MGRMEEICMGIEQSDLARKLRIYNTNDLPSGIWEITDGPLSEEVFLEEAIPLLSGTTLRAGHVSEQDYSMVWTLSESPEPDISELKVGWKEYDPNPARSQQSWSTVWKYDAPGITGEYYLTKAGDNSRCDENAERREGQTATWSSWAGEFKTQCIYDFTSDSSYSILYLPEEPQQSVDNWIFVTDEPLPGAEIDIRIDPFE